MSLRMNYRDANPHAFEMMMKMEQFIRENLVGKLYELIKIRASQINRCAFCLNMHTQDARKMGETEQRIYLLNAWREAPYYTDAERAVLALTEAVTLVSENGVPDEVFEAVRAHFSEREIVLLIMAINTINSWNRLAITTGLQPA